MASALASALALSRRLASSCIAVVVVVVVCSCFFRLAVVTRQRELSLVSACSIVREISAKPKNDVMKAQMDPTKFT